MVESDLEGPWVKADHAFDVVSKGIPNGERVFRVISAYDDVRFFYEKVPGYEPGDTLMLVAPLLIAHGVGERFLRDVASSAENTRLIQGARDVVQHISRSEDFFLISTSYSQYVEAAARILGVPLERTFSTSFPIDEIAGHVAQEDMELVASWTERISEMPPIEATGDGSLLPECLEAKAALDEFYWEILPATSFAGLMAKMRPVGGERKFRALLEALHIQRRELADSAVVGDSITDSVMLSKAKAAGALALSFNGNSYCLRSSNVAIISGTCWATAAAVQVYRGEGLDGLRRWAGTWSEDRIGQLSSQGLIDRGTANGLISAHRSGLPHPRVLWVDDCDFEGLVRESESYRKAVRGDSIGGLG